MCGGAEEQQRGPEMEQDRLPPGTSYNPAALKDVYKQFRDDGTVPYSYYGVGAPTRKGEMDLVRKSYPGSFTTAPPAPTPGGQALSRPNIGQILASILAGGGLGGTRRG